MTYTIEIREEEVLAAIKKLQQAEGDIAKASSGPTPNLTCAAQPTAMQEFDDMIDWALVELKVRTNNWQHYLATQADNIKATVEDLIARDESFSLDLNTDTGWVENVQATTGTAPASDTSTRSTGSPSVDPGEGETESTPAPAGSGGSSRPTPATDGEDNG
ncbi:hypothetical protein GCM10022198_15440 [Klugiella xanthotipulae]|uniref:Uncharacterized protein n=1 Tax=Klugiella xanthotipulae TaxID=244735 RepID=A0A543HGX5_9MICO|nr:hypothetical protein [Klugiella xanthotipulae]TQM57582.1 hypothetical protein FB466_2575 [Klugiella xanthotipulae]